MNTFVIFLLTVTICVVCAEPPQYRQQRLRKLSRQEAIPTTTEQDETTTENDSSYPQSSPSVSGPYAPSGWKPSGQLLVLPFRQQKQQQQQQQQQYGPPQQYGTPTTEYGTPEDDSSSTAEASDSSDSNETTDEPDSEILEDGPSQAQPTFNGQSQQQQPGYFVQLADGSVQRVLYVATANNGAAKLQAQPVVQAQPLFIQPFYVPQAVSFSSQYQSW